MSRPFRELRVFLMGRTLRARSPAASLGIGWTPRGACDSKPPLPAIPRPGRRYAGREIMFRLIAQVALGLLPGKHPALREERHPCAAERRMPPVPDSAGQSFHHSRARHQKPARQAPARRGNAESMSHGLAELLKTNGTGAGEVIHFAYLPAFQASQHAGRSIVNEGRLTQAPSPVDVQEPAVLDG